MSAGAQQEDKIRDKRRTGERPCRREELLDKMRLRRQGRPVREPGDDCCAYYRFREETGNDLQRCGMCQDYYGNGTQGVCVNRNNLTEAE